MNFDINDSVSLKLLQSQDAVGLFALVDKNREYLKEWLPWLDKNTSEQDSESFIASLHQQLDNKQGFSCGIFFKNKLIGICGYHPINQSNQSVTIGYWIDKERQGYGIVTQCTKFFIHYAFNELRLNKVLIPVAEGNKKSRAVCERLGLKNEGTERDAENLYGDYVNHIRYSILRSEWEAD